jgi:ankyrin repeat protein
MVRCRLMLALCRRTALHLASEKGHTETVKALASAGADVNALWRPGLFRSGSTYVVLSQGLLAGAQIWVELYIRDCSGVFVGSAAKRRWM